MAAIAIFAGSVDVAQAPNGRYRVFGYFQVEGAPEPQFWEAFVPWNATPAQVNSSCQEAAIAAARTAGHAVERSDTKTFFAGAMRIPSRRTR